MKKLLSLLSIFLLLLSSILPSVSTVSAEEVDKEFQDGTYDLPVTIFHAEKDEKSKMDDYIVDHSSTVNVKDGKATVELTLTDSDAITVFQTEQNGELKDVATISENPEDKTRTIRFPVAHLDQELVGEITVSIPDVYEQTHPVRMQFDTSGLEIIEVLDSEEMEETEEQQEVQKPIDKDIESIPESDISKDENKSTGKSEATVTSPEKGTEEEVDVAEKENTGNKDTVDDSNFNALKDGIYSVTLDALHAEENKPSSMGRYIKEEAIIHSENGKIKLTLTILDSNTITGFQVNGKSPGDEQISESANTREVTYTLSELSAIMQANVQYTEGAHSGNQPLRLALNENSVKRIADLPEKDSNIDQKYEDGVYELPLKVLQANNDDSSSMGNFVKNPAVTIEKGKATVRLTLTSSSMITEFKTKQNGEMVDVEIISEDKGANTRVVSFPVEDLDKILDGSIIVDAGPLGNMSHDVRFKFDTSGLPKVDIQEPDVPETENPNETKPEIPKPEKPKDPAPEKQGVYENGTYKVPVTVLDKDKKKGSEMQDYVDTNAEVKIVEGKATVFLTLHSSDWIPSFKTNRNGKLVETKQVSENKKNNTRVVSFPVENLDGLLKAEVAVDANGLYEAKHTVFLSFNTSGIPVAEGQKRPSKPTSPKPNTTDQKNKSSKTKGQKAMAGIYEDGTFEIPVIIYKDSGPLTKENFSVMNDYVVQDTSYVTIKNGKATVSLTMKNSEMIKGFQVGPQNNLKTAARTKLSADKSEFSFPVKDLDNLLYGKVAVTVPGMYEMEHKVRLAFDTSKVPVQAGKERPQELVNAAAFSEYDGPGFDRNADELAEAQSSKVNTINPKTIDTNMTKVLFFALLLVGSMIPLAMKLRRRFAVSE